MVRLVTMVTSLTTDLGGEAYHENRDNSHILLIPPRVFVLGTCHGGTCDGGWKEPHHVTSHMTRYDWLISVA